MIKIIDSIMGSGKTSYAIQMMNENSDKKYVYITPYLDEVQRIKDNCNNFEEPESNIRTGELKLDSLNSLLSHGKNVVSTHALFKLTTKFTIDQLKKWNYTLIIDEVMEVVSNDDFKKDDLPTILDAGLAHIDDITGYLIWDRTDYDGAYNKIKRLCTTKSVIVVDNVALVWVFPAAIFKAFSETYICTYMFDAQVQRYYFDMNKMEYEYYSVAKKDDHYQLIQHDTAIENRDTIKINIYSGKKNYIGTVPKGKDKSAFGYLSSKSYSRATKEQLKQMKNNIYGFFYNDLKRSPSELNLWTAFVKNKKDLEGKGYTNGFLACNARAINSYRNKTAVAYVVNRFMNPYIIKFFKINGVTISKGQQLRYGLSELLQFLFRSAIRDHKPINLYIPSVRMRHALQEWLGIPKQD